jgi:hypothetical protein
VIAASGGVVSHWRLDAALVTGVRRVSEQAVWVAKDDGSDIIRADAIAGVGRDYNGNITARLAGGDGSAVTLVALGASDGPHTPEDFHRQLIKVVAELSHTAEATLVRPICDDAHGWRWANEPM